MIYLIGIGCGVFNYLLYTVCIRDWHTKKETSLLREMVPSTWKKVIVVAVSIAGAILLSNIFRVYGYGPLKIVKYCLLIGGLIPIAYRDLKEKCIPNRWLIYLVSIRGVLLLTEAIMYPSAFLDNIKFTLFGAIGSGAILFLAYVLSRHQIGLGDVKLFIVIGMYLGASITYIVILMSLIIAACYGGIKVITKKMNVKDEIAFGPFVAIGVIIILGLGF